MRYLAKRDTAGEWGIFDVRRQKYLAQGLTLEEAKETAEKENRKNAEEVKNFLDDNMLPR